MIPLSALSDPAAFLQGARVPLVRVVPDPLPEWAVRNPRLVAEMLGQRWDWLIDGSWVFEGGTASLVTADPDWTALDPADPDVARWCDRKIAEALFGHPVHAAVLDHDHGRWIVRLWSQEPAQILAVAFPGTDSIPCDDAHIPQARAALVLALHGRTP